MTYVNDIIDTLGKEIAYQRVMVKHYQEEKERLAKENEELRAQIERMIKEQVLDPVFGEGQNGKL